MDNKYKEIIIYSDGACKGNPGPGGWGAVLIYNDNKKEIFGGEHNTTNNKMELTAVIKALEEIKTRNIPVKIITDSQYVKNGIESWIHNWKKNNWKNASKKPVKNSDLWKRLDALVNEFQQIKWEWVKGHNNNKFNELADKLANKGVSELH
jgi:ribonuclease HI